MGVVSEQTWHSANQRYLMASLERVRAALERHTTRRRATNTPQAETPDISLPLPAPAKMRGGRPAALQRLRDVFGLSPFESDVLLLCAGIELDGGFPALCASAHGDTTRPWPTFGLALAAFVAGGAIGFGSRGGRAGVFALYGVFGIRHGISLIGARSAGGWSERAGVGPGHRRGGAPGSR